MSSLMLARRCARRALLLVVLAGASAWGAQVPEPIVIPSGGTFRSPIAVAALPGSADIGIFTPFGLLTFPSAASATTLRYTIDGTVPTENSPVLTEPLVLTESTTVLVRGFAAGSTPSVPVANRYVIAWNDPVAAPTIQPPPGVYHDVVQATLTSPSRFAVVRATTDGSLPSWRDPVASAPLVITSSTTVRARTFPFLALPSVQTIARYDLVVADPSIAPAPGTYANAQTVTIASTTPGCLITYTLDGTDPTPSSMALTGPFMLSGSATVLARAWRDGFQPSGIARGTYAYVASAPVVTPAPGTYDAPPQIALSSATDGVDIRYTLDGTDPTAASTLYTAPFVLQTSATLTARCFRAGFTTSEPLVAAYVVDDQAVVQFVNATLTVSEGGGDQLVALTLDKPANHPVTVSVQADPSDAIPGTDFTLASTSVVIPAGSLVGNLPVHIIDNSTHQADRTALLEIIAADGALVGSQTLCALLIQDDDPLPVVRFAAAASTVHESSGVDHVQVVLDRASAFPVSVSVAYAGGTAVSGQRFLFTDTAVTFAPSATSATVDVQVHESGQPLPDQTVDLVLSSPSGASIGDPSRHESTIQADARFRPCVEWNVRARALVARHNIDPPMASRFYALLSVAQDRAAAGAIATGASEPVAVVSASLRCLATWFAVDGDELTSAAAADEAAAWWPPTSERVLAADAAGAMVAARVLARAASDGSDLVWTRRVPTGPGLWYSSWTYTHSPLRPLWGSVRPWFLARGDQLRPAPPPAFGSADYLAALQEVREIADSRTSDQYQIAAKWSDGPGTQTPAGHWNAIAADEIAAADLDDAHAAHMLAVLNAAMMDAGIATWDAKYTWWLIRPYQADQAISTPIGQPNFPSYISGHATFSGAAATVLSSFFPADAATLDEMAQEASWSRVLGGIHYRFDCDAGLAVGHAIGTIALSDDADGVWNGDLAPSVMFMSPATGAPIVTAAVPFTGSISGSSLSGTTVQASATTAAGTSDVSSSLVLSTAADGSIAFSWTPPADSDGVVALTVLARTADGHLGSGTASERIDANGAPRITIISPPDGTLLGLAGSTTVAGTVDQPVAELTINSVHVDTTPDGHGGVTFSQTMTVAPLLAAMQPFTLIGGDNLVEVAATDLAGLTQTAHVTIVADVTPPTVRIESPADGQIVTGDHVSVVGLIQDVVLGTVTDENASVTVNGVAASIANRSFEADDVPLADGPNTLHAIAVDAAGNSSEQTITVIRRLPAGERIAIVAGDRQQAPVGTLLGAPLQVRVTGPAGAPVASQAVTLSVTHGDATFPAAPPDDARTLRVLTDVNGLAQAAVTAGHRSGVGNLRVHASALGATAGVDFTATVVPGPVNRLQPVWGMQQFAAPNAQLAQPIIVWCIDDSWNPVPGAAVHAHVVAGGGGVAATRPAAAVTDLDVVADADGRATMWWTVGPAVGRVSQVLDVSLPAGSAGSPLRFLASTAQPVAGAPTTVSGIVLDANHQPLAGCTVVIDGSTTGAVSVGDGRFTIIDVPPGHRHITLMGATANTDTLRLPNIGYELDVTANLDNPFPMPLFLPAMDISGQQWAGGDQDVVLQMPGMPGYSVKVFAHSTIRADGTRAPVQMYTSSVNSGAVPMPPPTGGAPLLVATLQPAGTRLDPPAQVTSPNFYALPPGYQIDLNVFDHDLGTYVSYGTATVSEDGASIVTDPGIGLGKAGWDAFIPPSVSADIHGKLPDCTVHVEGPTVGLVGQDLHYKASVFSRDGLPHPATWSVFSGDSADGVLIVDPGAGFPTSSATYQAVTGPVDATAITSVTRIMASCGIGDAQGVPLVVTPPRLIPTVAVPGESTSFTVGPIHLAPSIAAFDPTFAYVRIVNPATGAVVSSVSTSEVPPPDDGIVISAETFAYHATGIDPDAVDISFHLQVGSKVPPGSYDVDVVAGPAAAIGTASTMRCHLTGGLRVLRLWTMPRVVEVAFIRTFPVDDELMMDLVTAFQARWIDPPTTLQVIGLRDAMAFLARSANPAPPLTLPASAVDALFLSKQFRQLQSLQFQYFCDDQTIRGIRWLDQRTNDGYTPVVIGATLMYSPADGRDAGSSTQVSPDGSTLTVHVRRESRVANPGAAAAWSMSKSDIPWISDDLTIVATIDGHYSVTFRGSFFPTHLGYIGDDSTWVQEQNDLPRFMYGVGNGVIAPDGTMSGEVRTGLCQEGPP